FVLGRWSRILKISYKGSIGKETDESDRPSLKPMGAEQLAIPDDVDIDQASSNSATDQPVHDYADDLHGKKLLILYI
ncbi:hypothetical protein MAR_014423, partial [Mya arenaria]